EPSGRREGAEMSWPTTDVECRFRVGAVLRDQCGPQLEPLRKVSVRRVLAIECSTRFVEERDRTAFRSNHDLTSSRSASTIREAAWPSHPGITRGSPAGRSTASRTAA